MYENILWVALKVLNDTRTKVLSNRWYQVVDKVDEEIGIMALISNLEIMHLLFDERTWIKNISVLSTYCKDRNVECRSNIEWSSWCSKYWHGLHGVWLIITNLSPLWVRFPSGTKFCMCIFVSEFFNYLLPR